MEKGRGGVLYDLSYPRFLLTKQPEMIYRINEDLCVICEMLYLTALRITSQRNCRKGHS